MTEPKKRNSHYRTDNYNSDPLKDEIDSCAKFVVGEWDAYDEYGASRFNDFEKYYDRWKGKPPQRDEEWQANFNKRLTWQAEKTLVARFHSALFPVSAPIDVEAVETQDEIQKILARSIVSHWFKTGLFSKEFLSGMRSAAIYGTGLFEDDWYLRKEQISEKTEIEIPDYRSLVDVNGNKVTDENGNIKVEEIGKRKTWREQSRLKIVEDRYRVRKANIFAWRVHPNKIDDDDDYPVIKQEFVNYDTLLEREAEAEKYGFSKFENMDKVHGDKQKIKEEDARRLQKGGDYIDRKNPKIELLTYWGLYSEKEGELKKPMWIIIANRKYILRKQENPYWHKKPPMFHIVWTEDEKPNYYGIGLAQIGEDAEDRVNTNVNIRIDERKKNVRGGGWYNAMDKKIKKSDLQKNIPGHWKACSDVNLSVRPDMPVPKSSADDYKEEETSVNDHREITGATTSLLPTANINEQHKTLGGMELLVNQGVQRLKPDLVVMELMGIRRMANRALLLTRQFMTKEEAVELVASEDKLKQFNLSKVYLMSPKELIGGIHFFCTGLSESIEKIQNIDKAIQFMGVLQKTAPNHPFVNYLIKKIAFWLGFEDAGSFFETTQQVPGVSQVVPGQIPAQVSPGVLQIPNQQMLTPSIPAEQPQGLPPQILQMIVQQMMQGQGANQAGMM